MGLFLKSHEKLSGPKSHVLLRPAFSVKLVFYVVKLVVYVLRGIKIKISANFRATRRLRFEDAKRIRPSEMQPKSFGTFATRAPDVACSLRCKGCFTKGTAKLNDQL